METEPKQEFSLKQLILYKVDRTAAVLGLTAIAIVAVLKGDIADNVTTVLANVSQGLGIVLAVRVFAGKK